MSTEPIFESTPVNPRTKAIALGAVGVVVLVILAVLAAFLVPPLLGGNGDGYSGPNTDWALVSIESRGGDYELAMVRWDDTEAEPVLTGVPAGFSSAYLLTEEGGSMADHGGPFIGSVTGTDEQGDQLVVIDPETGDVDVLLETEGNFYSTWYAPASGLIVAQEYVFDEDALAGVYRCYVGSIEERFEEIVEADYCVPGTNGEWILAEDGREDGLYDYEVVSLDGERLLLETRAARATPVWDGTALAVVDGEIGDRGIRVVSIADGDDLFSDEGYENAAFLDDVDGAILIGTADEDGLSTVWRVGTDGAAESLLTAEGSLEAGFAGDADHVGIVTRTDEGRELWWQVGSDEPESLTTSEYIDLELSRDAEYPGLVATLSSDDENGNADGEFLVVTDAGTDTLRVRGDWYIDSSLVTAEGRYWWIVTDGGANSLVVIDMATGESTVLVDAWESVQLGDVSRDGTALLASGSPTESESDSVLLYVTAEGVVEEIPDSGGLEYYATFTPDSDAVAYWPAGRDFSDDPPLETLTYAFGSGERPETLWDDAVIVEAGWSFASSSSTGTNYPGYLEVRLANPTCNETWIDLTALEPGDSQYGYLNYGGSASFCVDFAEEGTHQIWASGFNGIDLTMTVRGPYFPDGSYSGSEYYNDDYEGLNPAVEEYFEQGAYLVIVEGYNGNASGDYGVGVD